MGRPDPGQANPFGEFTRGARQQEAPNPFGEFVRARTPDPRRFAEEIETGELTGGPATSLSPADESRFRAWYAGVSSQLNLSPDPDDPLHFYDYRGFFRSGEPVPQDAGEEFHFPSEFKREGHPNLIVAGRDTRTGRRIVPDPLTLEPPGAARSSTAIIPSPRRAGDVAGEPGLPGLPFVQRSDLMGVVEAAAAPGKEIINVGFDVAEGVLTTAEKIAGMRVGTGEPLLSPESGIRRAREAVGRRAEAFEQGSAPTTGIGQMARLPSRVAAEIGMFVAAAGNAPTTAARIGQSFRRAGPLDFTIAASSPETSGAQAIVDMAAGTDSEIAETLRRNPLLRGSLETAFGMTGELLVEAVRGFRQLSRLDPAGDLFEGVGEAVESIRPSAAAVDDQPARFPSIIERPAVGKGQRTGEPVVRGIDRIPDPLPAVRTDVERTSKFTGPIPLVGPDLGRGQKASVIIDPGTVITGRPVARAIGRARDEAGAVNPQIANEIARVGSQALFGGVMGSLYGDTPEEKIRNAAVGAVVVAGGLGARRAVIRSAEAKRIGEAAEFLADPSLLDGLSLNQIREVVRQDLVDAFEPIVRFAREAGEEGMSQAEMFVRASTGSAALAEEIFRRGVTAPGTLERRSKGLAEIFKPIEDALGEFRMYAIGRRVVHDLAPRGIPTRVDVETAQRWLDELGDRPDLDLAFAELQEFQNAWMRLLEEEGVLRAGAAEAIIRDNPNYIPFQAAVPGEPPIGAGRGFADIKEGVHRIKGNTEFDLLDPLGQLSKNNDMFAGLIMRQRASRALAELADAWPDNPFMRRMAPDDPRLKERVTFSSNQLRGQIPEEVFREIDPKALDAFVARRITKEEPIVRVRGIDGQIDSYELAPDMLRAVMNLDSNQLAGWAKLLSPPARWLRTGVTLTPEFQASNLMRDLLLSNITSKTTRGGLLGVVETAADAARGIFHIVGDAIGRDGDEVMQLWRTTGGPFGAFQSSDTFAKEIRAARSRGERILTGSPVTALRALGDGLRGVGIAVENGPRMGEFIRQLEREFGSLDEALAAARRSENPDEIIRGGVESKDVTVDFSRHGAATANVRPIAGFWNARLQGFDKIVRAAQEDPKRFWGTIAASITMPSIGLYALNRENPDYWKRPVWERNMFWLVPLPGEDADGDTRFIRIPKPHELGWLFGSVPERILEAFDSANPERNAVMRTALGDTWDDMTQMLESFAPAPTAIVPWVENWRNRDNFNQRPVVPYFEANEDIEPRLKGRDQSSVIARAVADVINVPPGQVENVFMDYFGNAYRDISDIVDKLGRPEDQGPAPSWAAGDRLFVQRFYRDDEGAKSVTDFYDMERRIRGLRREVRSQAQEATERAQRTGRSPSTFPEAAFVREKVGANAELLLKWDVVNQIGKEMRLVREAADRIEKDTNMPGDQKRVALDRAASRMVFITSLATFGPEARERLMRAGHPQVTKQHAAWAVQLERAEAATRNR